jgi:uncharacterized membrane protein
MPLRSPRERLVQTLCHEAGGLLLSVPPYLPYAGQKTGAGALSLLARSVAVMIRSPVQKTMFDRAGPRLSVRVARDRPQTWRAVDAIRHEATTLVVTLPTLIWMGGHGLREALLLGLD